MTIPSGTKEQEKKWSLGPSIGRLSTIKGSSTVYYAKDVCKALFYIFFYPFGCFCAFFSRIESNCLMTTKPYVVPGEVLPIPLTLKT